ncbi:aminoglycoside phosphotransferase family protein [Actinomadura sp. ATCC 31491]|uniref:Aminoglycoside phosphotransferase family protein n=1 Tax=Actinomadura luzonensis TaxID=2805427 RepID=A0ABT0FTF6_9ACTN|nr:phosphotransferase [Actinomadura luzonensis]MCK2215161.1 aminoglycoside phosphotransferase family protein [Actinomadura luzonensis]
MPDLQHTHEVAYDGDVVTKRYLGTKPGAAEREWRALTLLAEHAPGLAPRPIAFEAGVVSMSRLDGVPLRGLPAPGEHAAALADALAELHAAVPARVLRDVPVRPWQREAVCDWIRLQGARWRPRGPLADRAVREGLRWLAGWRPGESGVTPVFGAGDGNLANFLWDGSRVRIVDFEDSGRSDLAYELAELAEHVSMWVDGDLEIARRFELSPQEERRLRECRKAHTLVWLFLLSHDDPADPRNPPGTFDRQAERVLATLGA